MKKDKKIEIIKRIDIENNNISELNETREKRYTQLKEKLKILIKDEAFNKIETARILKEINDSKLYVLDGHKSFNSFIIDYKMAKTSVYRYIKLVVGIDSGKIDYDFILKNGVDFAVTLLANENIIKKSNINPIKPLRFQLKTQKAYDFYKENTKFTSFIMDKLFNNYQDLLKNELEEFKKEKEDK